MENKKLVVEIDVGKELNKLCIDMLKCVKGYAISKRLEIENCEKRISVSQAYIAMGKIEAFKEMSKYIDTYIKAIEENK